MKKISKLFSILITTALLVFVTSCSSPSSGSNDSTITIKLHSNDGNDNTVTIHPKTNSFYQIDPNIFSREGYTLVGFGIVDTDYIGSPNCVAIEDPLNVFEDLDGFDFYAIWSRPITVKLYKGQNFGDPSFYEEITLNSNYLYYMPWEDIDARFIGKDQFDAWKIEKKDSVIKGYKYTLKNSQSYSYTNNRLAVSDDLESVQFQWYDPISTFYYFKPGYNSGTSHIYKYTSSGTIKLFGSLLQQQSSKFSKWSTEPYGEGTIYDLDAVINYDDYNGKNLKLYAIFD